MSYEFNGMLYDTESIYYRAIAESWLTADGLNNKHGIINFLDNLSSEALAKECYEEWCFDNLPEDIDYPDRSLLVKAFRELSTNRVWLNDVT